MNRCLHSKRAGDDQNVVVFSFLKNYRNVSSSLNFFISLSKLLFPSIIMSDIFGPMSEFPGASIDCFNDQNLKSTVYFLSHCQTDHMVGLVKITWWA